MTLTSLLIFTLALLLNAGSPGPSIASLVSRVLSRGVDDVLPFVAAMWIGEITWLAAAIFGLSKIAAIFGLGFLIFKHLGVAYLLYLAWKMWHQPVNVTEEIPLQSNPTGMFLSGLALTLGNPKIMVFYIALLPTFFDLNALTFFEGIIIAATTLFVLATIDLSYIALASRARHLFKSSRAIRRVNRTSATMMGGAAVAIATQ